MSLVLVPVFLMLSLQNAGPAGISESLEYAKDLYRAGRVEEARGSIEDLLPRLRSLGERKQLGDALNALSVIDSSLGRYSRAYESARESASIWTELHDRVGLAQSTNNMGLALMYLGDYPAALKNYQRALELDLENRDAEGEVLRRNNIGNVYFFQGRYGEALDQYQLALGRVKATAGEAWNLHERQRTTANLAALYQKLGLYERALELYLEAPAADSTLTSSERARVLSNQGALYRRLGDPVKALDTYRAALRLFAEQRHFDGEIGVWKNIGIAMAMDLEDFAGALQSFDTALKLAEKTSNVRESIQARLYRGEVHRRLGRTSEAAADFRASREEAGALGLPEEQWKALYGLGRIAEELGNHQEARELYRRAVDFVESVRSRLQILSVRAGFLADKRDVFDALVRLELQQASPPSTGDREGILRLMERSRSRSFQDHLRQFAENTAAAENPELAGKLGELRAQMAILWSRLMESDRAARPKLHARLSELEASYLETEIRLSSLSGASARDPSISLPALQTKLSPESAIVEVWTGESDLALLWVSRSATGLVRRALTDAVDKKVRSCSEAISRPHGPDWREECSGLGRDLLAGLTEQLGPAIRNLMIVTDEKLSFLPFEILELPDRSLLVERYNVAYLPSASLLGARTGKSSLRSRMPWAMSLRAFGDPWIREEPSADSSRHGFQPQLERIPYSAEEVRNIAARLHGRKELYLGTAARKDVLLNRTAESTPLLHLSTHAAIDSENPERSWIAFSSSGGTGAEFLFLGEVFNLPLRGTDLVTLSACETARGKLVRGEGIMDFGRAFLMSGAGATLTTLWRVADHPTAEFMERFYSRVADEEPLGAALRDAKLQFLRSGSELSHPYYWAGFVLAGNVDLVVTQPLSWAAFSAAATLFGLILAGGASWLIRSRGHDPGGGPSSATLR